MTFKDPSQRRRSNKQWKFRVICRKKIQKIIQWFPPFDHFQGRNKNHSSLAKRISASRRSIFANLTTFERRYSKSQFWKWGNCQNFKVIGPEEMPNLFWGSASAPKLKWDRPKTYQFWQSPKFQNFVLPVFGRKEITIDFDIEPN